MDEKFLFMLFSVPFLLLESFNFPLWPVILQLEAAKDCHCNKLGAVIAAVSPLGPVIASGAKQSLFDADRTKSEIAIPRSAGLTLLAMTGRLPRPDKICAPL
jgi:hypothetical protein